MEVTANRWFDQSIAAAAKSDSSARPQTEEIFSHAYNAKITGLEYLVGGHPSKISGLKYSVGGYPSQITGLKYSVGVMLHK